MVSPTFLFMLASVASISLYSGPRPEETVTYKDWVTGCDNVRNCAAVALEVEPSRTDGGTDHLEIMVEQPLARHLGPSVSLKFPFSVAPQPHLRLFVDHNEVNIPTPVDQRIKIEGAAAHKLIGQMLKGNWALLLDVEGKTVARASLSGLTASLLRVDEQQGKDGTPSALARPGKRVPYDDLPGYSVSLTRPAKSLRPPTKLSATAIAGLRANEKCTIDIDTPATPQIVRLDSDSSMAIMPWHCGNGAYNLYSNIMIINGFGEVRPATFDYDNGITGDGPSNVLVNVVWDDDKRVLEGFARHRGIGDCGRVDRYIWSGTKFMLSEQLVMPECRMAFDRIRVWKVDVVER
ncbi:DUF1176 domain-containing protein [Sphingorhabdus contaminans]|uniref:DUF1176 domain-containing protein n=1 Tax=Sphingorhabdus contaminans TaxID=1343899 RepID=UPI003D2CDDCE